MYNGPVRDSLCHKIDLCFTCVHSVILVFILEIFHRTMASIVIFENVSLDSILMSEVLQFTVEITLPFA